MDPLPGSGNRLRLELRRLDWLLGRQVLRFRAANLLARNDDLRGLYVSDEQVDALLQQQDRSEQQPADSEQLQAALFRATCRSSLADVFGLDDFEQDVLLLAVAPELELRYELIYSYLNDDVTRKRPNCDLALRLFCAGEEERWIRRRHFTAQAPLFRFGLLQWLTDTAESPNSWLARPFFAPQRVVNHLLGLPFQEPKLTPFTQHLPPRQNWDDLPIPRDFLRRVRGVRRLVAESPSQVLVFEGDDGPARQSCAEVLCREMGHQLLLVDGRTMLAEQTDLRTACMFLAREQRLVNAGIYVHNAESFFDEVGRVLPWAYGLTHSIRSCRVPLIFGCSRPCDFKALLSDLPMYSLRFPMLPFELRRRVWQCELSSKFGETNGADLDSLANQFLLTSGQIRGAVAAAHAHARLHGTANRLPGRKDLLAAARAQSTQELRSLAQPIEPIYTWKDLVLPPAVMTQLREIEHALKYRHVVFSRWGFERRLSMGKGLTAMFAGPSGCGKTMAAEVIAGSRVSGDALAELQLDLYKIDLASVVSKYIGETEKNLDRIFCAAQSSNAILFFDEADALFGKRSVTKDAHDRYANIEVSYLLSKIEEYNGFVILATNLMQNMDEAFKRRITYVVEFPFPDEAQRAEIWRAIFPARTPVADDVDVAFLARQFPFSGGNIKNAALTAAFLAAADGGRIHMHHVIAAVAREWHKLGKLPSPAEFKQYYELVLQNKATPTNKDSSISFQRDSRP